MYRIYARQKIEAGLQDIEQGRVIEHEDVLKEWQE
jgi:predicted transcriptional regulator